MATPTPRFFTSPRFTPYREALIRLSARTGASIPSLCASFLVLHEVTAIVPFVGIFYASRALGVGEQVVQTVVEDDVNGDIDREIGMVKRKAREWVDEGGQMAERLGKRYGLFGYEKRTVGEAARNGTGDIPLERQDIGAKIAGDVANVVVAYGVTKVGKSSSLASCMLTNNVLRLQALLPLRLGLSLYLSPPFSRLVFEPLRRTLTRTVARYRASGRAVK